MLSEERVYSIVNIPSTAEDPRKVSPCLDGYPVRTRFQNPICSCKVPRGGSWGAPITHSRLTIEVPSRVLSLPISYAIDVHDMRLRPGWAEARQITATSDRALENAFVVPPYDIQVLIPQSQPIPHDVTLTQPGTFPVATFSNNILDSI